MGKCTRSGLNAFQCKFYVNRPLFPTNFTRVLFGMWEQYKDVFVDTGSTPFFVGLPENGRLSVVGISCLTCVGVVTGSRECVLGRRNAKSRISEV